MGAGLVTGFLQAKMRDVKTGVALYSVSSDLDGAKIVRRNGSRSNKAIAAMLASASEPLVRDLHLVASMLQGAMAGISRRLLESAAPEKQLEALQTELVFFVCAYLEAGSGGRRLHEV